MNSAQRKTLEAIFAEPANGAPPWRDIESLLLALGCRMIEGAGSSVTFEKDGMRVRLHRPHPRKEALRYRVKRHAPISRTTRVRTMKAMMYKSYAAFVEFDAEDRLFIGHIAGIRDVVGFHGATVDELQSAFHEAVDDYLTAREKLGQKPNKPYAGKLMLRVPPEVPRPRRHDGASPRPKPQPMGGGSTGQRALGKSFFAPLTLTSQPRPEKPRTAHTHDGKDFAPPGLAARLHAER